MFRGEELWVLAEPRVDMPSTSIGPVVTMKLTVGRLSQEMAGRGRVLALCVARGLLFIRGCS